MTKYNVYLNQDQGNKWTASYWIAAVSKWVHYTILGDKDGNLIDSEHPLDVRPSLPTGASTSAKQDALAALVGEVQADPTENTVLERLKVLETELVDIKSTSGVKKITDAVDVSDKAERELGVVTLGGSLPSFAAIPSVKFDQTTPGTTNGVAVTAGNETLVKTTSDTNAEVAATNGTETITFAASAGKLARLVDLNIYVPAPSGAGSGTHDISISLGVSGGSYDKLLTVSAAFGGSITIARGRVVTPAPANDAINTNNILMLKDIVFSPTTTLQIVYRNLTNVAQSGQRRYRATKMEWKVV